MRYARGQALPTQNTKQIGRKSQNLKANITIHIVLTISNASLTPPRGMVHVARMKQKSSRKSPLDTADTCKRCPLLGSVAFTGITGLGRGGKGWCGGSRAVFISYTLQQLVKTSAGVVKVQVAEDPCQHG